MWRSPGSARIGPSWRSCSPCRWPRSPSSRCCRARRDRPQPTPRAVLPGWTLIDFAMLVLGTAADGGTASPLVLLFFVPVVFSSMSYPLGSVVAVGLLSVASYLGVALATGGIERRLRGRLCAVAALHRPPERLAGAEPQAPARARWRLASRTDPLTGCLNRRGFEERADAEIASMSRQLAQGRDRDARHRPLQARQRRLRTRRRRRAAVLGRADAQSRRAPWRRGRPRWAATSSRSCCARSGPTARGARAHGEASRVARRARWRRALPA